MLALKKLVVQSLMPIIDMISMDIALEKGNIQVNLTHNCRIILKLGLLLCRQIFDFHLRFYEQRTLNLFIFISPLLFIFLLMLPFKRFCLHNFLEKSHLDPCIARQWDPLVQLFSDGFLCLIICFDVFGILAVTLQVVFKELSRIGHLFGVIIWLYKVEAIYALLLDIEGILDGGLQRMLGTLLTVDILMSDGLTKGPHVVLDSELLSDQWIVMQSWLTNIDLVFAWVELFSIVRLPTRWDVHVLFSRWGIVGVTQVSHATSLFVQTFIRHALLLLTWLPVILLRTFLLMNSFDLLNLRLIALQLPYLRAVNAFCLTHFLLIAWFFIFYSILVISTYKIHF